MMRKPWFLNKVNPNFFYDYAKMFGERSPKDHDNCVERILNSQDHRLKQTTYNQVVLDDLQEEMNKFMAMQRGKRIQSAKVNMVGSKKEWVIIHWVTVSHLMTLIDEGAGQENW